MVKRNRSNIRGKLTLILKGSTTSNEILKAQPYGFQLAQVPYGVGPDKCILNLSPIVDTNGFVSLPVEEVTILREFNDDTSLKAMIERRIVYFSWDSEKIGDSFGITLTPGLISLLSELEAEFSVEVFSI